MDFVETSPAVFHAKKWGQKISVDFVEELIERAKLSESRKARLCLHPNSKELTQFTYLALIGPYQDKTHFHPLRPEIMIPIKGIAELMFFNHDNEITDSQILDSKYQMPVTIQPNEKHSLKLISENFVFMEIGNGPFTSESTKYV